MTIIKALLKAQIKEAKHEPMNCMYKAQQVELMIVERYKPCVLIITYLQKPKALHF
ncbi:uncharacterized protein G2W53_044303 [Senna tora]|uniref:Uncharacterized protein n=1 Tax=Senna tora TaxID=362788 RepID=A0A834W0X2_9FABA|nr:uncharacterized protein G2W53_044303 [Senna tora]